MRALGPAQSGPGRTHISMQVRTSLGQPEGRGSLPLHHEICRPLPSPYRGISFAPIFFFKCFLVKLEYAMRRQSFVAEI